MSPLFEYVCTKCGLKREILCSVTGEMRPSDYICPQCGGQALRKVPSASNFKVKDGTPIYGGKE